MTLLEWSQALELDIAEIDEQHRTLLDTLNDLNEQILTGTGSTGCALALQRMQEYTVVHFKAEEELMAKSEYPRLEPHTRLHQRFIDEVDTFSAEDCENNPEKALKVLIFLQEWLVDHILGPDLVFARHYKAWEDARI